MMMNLLILDAKNTKHDSLEPVDRSFHPRPYLMILTVPTRNGGYDAEDPICSSSAEMLESLIAAAPFYSIYVPPRDPSDNLRCAATIMPSHQRDALMRTGNIGSLTVLSSPIFCSLRQLPRTPVDLVT